MGCADFLVRPGEGGRAIVLLPGFATDRRIFDDVPVGGTAILPGDVPADRLPAALAAFLAERETGPVTLFGWSLGGFLAAAFAAEHPALVERVVLAGVRSRYPRCDLDRFREALDADREACLREFYAQCFLPAQKGAYRRFRDTLLPVYLRDMDAGRLREELALLGTFELRPDRLPPCPVTFLHGARDVVAPVDEVRALAAAAPGATLRVLPDAGHALFLSPGFGPVADAT